jgi:streptogramin lyase/cytochrome c2
MARYRALCTAAVLLSGAFVVGLATLSSEQSLGGTRPNDIADKYQRTYSVLNHEEVAKSGPGRGLALYFHKCLMCHSAFAAHGDQSGLVGPVLNDVSRRMPDAALIAKITDGGPLMPSFGANFTDADIADLVAYLKSPGCCYELQDPPKNPSYKADTVRWPVPTTLRGGPRGVVRAARGGRALEGIKVQVISPSNTRITVFTNDEGRYEFPALEAGSYTLRIATPLPWKAYVREGVPISGAATLEDIALELVPAAKPVNGHFVEDAFDPTPEVLSQMSGAEWLWNLPGSMADKASFTTSCSTGCHSYQNIFRNRYDERSWRLILARMSATSHLAPGGKLNPKPDPGRDRLAKWLATVAGPDTKLDPVRVWPARPTGAATRMVITEYEVNRRLLDIHDVCGPDSKGNIWFNNWHAPQIGYLDPRTGVIKEYTLPALADGRQNRGTHACRVDNTRGYVWISQSYGQHGAPWAHFRLTMATGAVKQFSPESEELRGNFGISPTDGSLWRERTTPAGNREIVRTDPETGQVTNAYPRTVGNSYQADVSYDGRFVAGASNTAPGGNYGWMLDVKTGKVHETRTDEHHIHGGARGAFDPFGHAWFGGRWGGLVQLVNEIDKGKGIRTRVFWPPTPAVPFTVFYGAGADKNGEAWAPLLHGRQWVRFNPKTERWVTYDQPEPSTLNRSFVLFDNSTKLPTVWYPEYTTGTIVRLQALE